MNNAGKQKKMLDKRLNYLKLLLNKASDMNSVNLKHVKISSLCQWTGAGGRESMLAFRFTW